MRRMIRNTIWDCLLDLGVTVIYAALAGLAIVAVVESDSGSVSLLKAAIYASLLPGAVVGLIVVDVALRVFAELRRGRQRPVVMGFEENPLSIARARTE